MTYLNEKGKNITVVMLGAGATGKSSITVQQVSGHFLVGYDPTIEDSYRTSILINGELITFEILDTAGQEEYSALRDSYIRAANCYICVCSLISAQSLIELHDFLNQIKLINDVDIFDNLPIIIAANKCDLTEQIEITDNDLEAIKNDTGIEYIKTSAKTKTNISLLFETVIKRYVEIQKIKHESENNSDVIVIDNRKKKNIFKKMGNKCVLF